jgi:hypothetical protein
VTVISLIHVKEYGFAEAAQRDHALREQQPFKAAHEHDFGWLGQAIVADTSGAEHVLDAGFNEISMRDDWATVFAP